MRVYGSNILDYITGKDSIEHTLKKWLYFTYPTHGQMIAQRFSDEFKWNKASIVKWISQYLPEKLITHKPKVVKAQLINPNIQPGNCDNYSKLKALPGIF